MRSPTTPPTPATPTTSTAPSAGSPARRSPRCAPRASRSTRPRPGPLRTGRPVAVPGRLASARRRRPRRAARTARRQVVAADADGNLVSLITTIGDDFGCLVAVPGTGDPAQQLDGELRPAARPRELDRPGKMPFFAVPAIVAARDGRGVFAAAGSGGYPILAGVVNTTVGARRARPGVQAAIDVPRVHSQGAETYIDARVPRAVRDELEAMGHTLVVQDVTPGELPFSRVSAVAVGRGRHDERRLRSGVDRRRRAACRRGAGRASRPGAGRPGARPGVDPPVGRHAPVRAGLAARGRRPGARRSWSTCRTARTTSPPPTTPCTTRTSPAAATRASASTSAAAATRAAS